MYITAGWLNVSDVVEGNTCKTTAVISALLNSPLNEISCTLYKSWTSYGKLCSVPN